VVRLAVGKVSRQAGVVELVDAPDSKSGSARSVGSIPTARTNFFNLTRFYASLLRQGSAQKPQLHRLVFQPMLIAL
jgi:hypothetical protein